MVKIHKKFLNIKSFLSIFTKQHKKSQHTQVLAFKHNGEKLCS